MKKKIVYGLAFILMLASLVFFPTCKRTASSSLDSESTFNFTDSAGRNVTLPSRIKSIVPSGSLAQMYLMAIAPDLFAAITAPYQSSQEEFLPPALAALPVIGQFYGQATFNPEEIAKISPDVIIDIGEPKDSIASDMDDIFAMTDVPMIHITAELLTTPQAFRTLGKLLNREAKGEELALYCERVLSLAQNIVNCTGGNKKSVLYCMGNMGLNVLAKNSYHSEILDWMTNNLAVVDNPSSRGSGNETNLEQLFLWNPEVILFNPGGIYATAKNLPVWKEFRAIQSNRYYEVPQSPFNWMGGPPSINRYLGILWMGAILYPEYAEYDLYEEAKEYYRLFYGYSLSREKFGSIVLLK